MAPALLTGANQNVTQALRHFSWQRFPHCTYSRDLTCARTDANTASAALTTQINTLRISRVGCRLVRARTTCTSLTSPR